MRDNCVIFTTPERQELRVVFDPDGTPFFCGPDLAAIAGYEQPRKAVTGGNQGVNRIESVLRKGSLGQWYAAWSMRFYLFFCGKRCEAPVPQTGALCSDSLAGRRSDTENAGNGRGSRQNVSGME